MRFRDKGEVRRKGGRGRERTSYIYNTTGNAILISLMNPQGHYTHIQASLALTLAVA